MTPDNKSKGLQYTKDGRPILTSKEMPITDWARGMWYYGGDNPNLPWDKRESYDDYTTRRDNFILQSRQRQAPKEQSSTFEDINPEAAELFAKYIPYQNKFTPVRAKYASEYTIPYNEENKITLTKGRFNTGVTSTDVLDAIYDASQKAGVDFKTALGLAARESGLGYARNFKKNGRITMTDLYSNWQQIHSLLNTNRDVEKYNAIVKKYNNKIKLAPKEIQYIDTFTKKRRKEIDSLHPITENPIVNALKYYRKGLYNPGDPNHTKMVNDDAEVLYSDPAIQKYLKSKGIKFSTGGSIRLIPRTTNILKTYK